MKHPWKQRGEAAGHPAERPENIPAGRPENIPAERPESIPAERPEGIPAERQENIPAERPEGIPVWRRPGILALALILALSIAGFSVLAENRAGTEKPAGEAESATDTLSAYLELITGTGESDPGPDDPARNAGEDEEDGWGSMTGTGTTIPADSNPENTDGDGSSHTDSGENSDTGNTGETGTTEKTEDTGDSRDTEKMEGTEDTEETGNAEDIKDTGDMEGAGNTGNQEGIRDTENQEETETITNTEETGYTGETEHTEDTEHTGETDYTEDEDIEGIGDGRGTGDTGEAENTATLAGPDGGQEERELTAQERKDAQKLDTLTERVNEEPEKLESLRFADVEQATREQNLTVRNLTASIANAEDTDFQQLEDDLRESLNALSGLADLTAAVSGSIAASSLQSSYESAYETFQSIRDGSLQRNTRDGIRQMESAVDQLVMVNESLYITLAALHVSESGLERQISALNRTVEELELRYKLGQIPELTLVETKAGRVAMVSGLETLKMNRRTLTMQLENLLGAAPTGELHIGTLPAVTEKEISSMNLEQDLAAAKDKSYELYAAARTLQDAEKEYSEKGTGTNRNSSTVKAAILSWDIAQNTYRSAVRSYELRFRTLYEQVRDYYQIWNAKKSALESEEFSCQVAELKYRQGNLSENALLTARDSRDAAEEAVRSAANDLFSAYNNYCWAVRHGILNS